MTYFFLTNRNVIQPRNGKATFGNDLSTPSYVISRKGASTIDPDDREKGTGNSKRWAQAIIEAAGGDTRDSHIVFFVPGFNTDAKDAYETNKILSENLVRNGLKKAAFVTFSWPSNGNIHQYLDDDNDARASAIHLVKSGIQVFAKMCAPDCNIRLHVISFSFHGRSRRQRSFSCRHRQTRDTTSRLGYIATHFLWRRHICTLAGK